MIKIEKLKFTPFAFSLILSFFFSISFVSAITYDYSIDDSYLNNLTTMKQTANDKLSTLSNYVYSIYRQNNGNYVAYFYNSPYYVPAFANGYISNPARNAIYCPYANNYTSLNCQNYNSYWDVVTPYNIIYSNYNIPIGTNEIGNTINFTYNNSVYSILIDSDTYLPNLEEVVDYFLQPIPSPTPEPDSYPILTSYYSTFLDRLSYLVDYVSNNYLLLSIFVIFIFYFSILLVRRLR